MSKHSLISLVCIVLSSVMTQADDWTQWRGPNHNNVVAAGQGTPTEWSESKNILWKVAAEIEVKEFRQLPFYIVEPVR